MYKDKNKQNEAAKKRMRRYRAQQKGVTESGRNGEGVTDIDLPTCVMRDLSHGVVPKIQDTPEFSIPNFGQPDCECMHCQQNRRQGSHHILNHGPHKPASELRSNELNRVALPGDVDYMRA